MKIAIHTKSTSIAFFLVIAPQIVRADKPPPIDPVGVYTLRSSEKRVTTQSSSEFPGLKKGRTGFSGVLKVDRAGEDNVIVALSGNKGFPSFNQGAFTATLAYRDELAIYTPVEYDKSCVITLKWLRTAVVVSQRSDDANTACGFGHAVTVDGVYKKVSSKRPRISAD